MSKSNGNQFLSFAALGIGALFLFGGRSKKTAAAEKMRPDGFVPKKTNPGGFTVPGTNKQKKRPGTATGRGNSILPIPQSAPGKPKPKPLTKKQARKAAQAKRKADRNSPAAKAARLKKTGMALDFLTNITSTAASTAAEFKK